MFKKMAVILGLLLSLPMKAMANPACPICTIAVGASLGIAREMGLSDNIVGLWAGALFTLLGYWLIKWFEKKNWNFFGRDIILIALSISMIGFIYIKDIIYTPIPIMYIFYLDAFLFSTLLGALIVIVTSNLYTYMKIKNGGRSHFPFEKVLLPVIALILASLYLNYYPIY